MKQNQAITHTESRVLEITDLNYRYQQKKVLEQVNLSLEAGKFYALLGPNGAGKSTLFSLICRLLNTEHGEIRVQGENIQKSPRSAMQSMGIVFQQSTLDLDLSIAQNLLYHASLHGIKRSIASQRMQAELSRFNLQDRQHEKVRNLNGGHRRRVEIARALLHQPTLLLLDEASVGLDVETRQSINQHIRQLCAKDGITVLSSTHQIDEITLQDHLFILHQGKVCLDAPCQKALSDQGCSDVATLYQKMTIEEAS
ncbi:ATP-binding cassette domain-containing protein [Aliiglaciecola lipolytica]|uniref:ATP-binding cassette domain-containing protein n=1 Tax=Aliiglaciecola lipolytica TaxID=477689 RepID=UPI00339D97B9